MDKKIKALIKGGESEILEFKENFSDLVIETLTAFSNANGGRVVIGIKDNGKVIGTDLSNESLKNFVNEIKQKTDGRVIPAVETQIIRGKTVAIFSVAQYPSRPISFHGKYFKRVKNSNIQMQVDEIADEYLRARNRSWDVFPSELNVADLDFEKIIKVIKKINENKIIKLEEDPLIFLKKYDLIRENKATNAAELLFAKKPFYFSEILIGLFEGETVIKKSATIRDDLFSEVEQVMDFITTQITKEYIITGRPQREERWQYPLSAVREFVINAVIHRDYQRGIHSQFKVFREKITLWNIGKLSPDITIDDLYAGTEKSFSRNPKIAEIFKDVGLIEKYGSGINRAVKEIVGYGLLKPIISQMAGGINVDILSNVPVNVTENVPVNVTENVIVKREDKLLNEIKVSNKVTADFLAKKYAVSIRTILRDLEKLRRAKKIIRVGPDKGGYWKII